MVVMISILSGRLDFDLGRRLFIRSIRSVVLLSWDILLSFIRALYPVLHWRLLL